MKTFLDSQEQVLNLAVLDDLQELSREPKMSHFLSDVLYNFIKTSEQEIPRFFYLLEKEFWEDLKQSSHKFKTLCGIVGAEIMYEICQEIEDRATEDRNSELIVLIQHLKTQYSKVRLALEIYMNKNLIHNYKWLSDSF